MNLKRRPQMTAWLVVAFFSLYVASYTVLSRRGFKEAERYRMEGFYFVPVDNPAMFRVHSALTLLYAPLIWLEQAAGTGRAPSSSPMFELS
jgi:hypothetical protein